MAPDIQIGDRIKYLGATDDQATFGGTQDPRMFLQSGETYEVSDVEVHSDHTRLWVRVWVSALRRRIPFGPFNSVCFEEDR